MSLNAIVIHLIFLHVNSTLFNVIERYHQLPLLFWFIWYSFIPIERYVLSFKINLMSLCLFMDGAKKGNFFWRHSCERYVLSFKINLVSLCLFNMNWVSKTDLCMDGAKKNEKNFLPILAFAVWCHSVFSICISAVLSYGATDTFTKCAHKRIPKKKMNK